MINSKILGYWLAFQVKSIDPKVGKIGTCYNFVNLGYYGFSFRGPDYKFHVSFDQK